VARRFGSSGNDRLAGTEGNDVLYGYSGRDVIFVSEEHFSSVKTGTKFDIFEFAGSSNSSQEDRVYAGGGNDIIAGVEVYIGDSRVPAENEQSFIDGGKGKDILIVNAFSWGFNSVLEAREIYQSVRTKSVEDIIIADPYGLGFVDARGTAKDDVFILRTEGTIRGRRGDDFLQVEESFSGVDNKLIGGKGKDTLAGGEGENTLNGGAGADCFILKGDGYAVIEDLRGKDKVFVDVYQVDGWNFDFKFNLRKAENRARETEIEIEFDQTSGALLFDGDQIATIQGRFASNLELEDIFII
jgi:Ca2+-binding RTX toxin-like protein